MADRKCAHCEKSLPLTGKQGRPRTTCSEKCKLAADAARKRKEREDAMKKEVTEIIDELRRQNWRVEVTSPHVKAFPPDDTKEMVVMSCTPSDHYAYKKNLGQLRRSGFVWPPPGKEKSTEVHDDRWYEREPEEKGALQLAEEKVIADALADSEPPSEGALVESKEVESEDGRIDRLFKRLRDARDTRVLALAEAETAEQKLREAIRLANIAKEQAYAAGQEFRAAKSEFDAALGISDVPTDGVVLPRAAE